MFKQFLNSVIAKYRDLSLASRSIIDNFLFIKYICLFDLYRDLFECEILPYETLVLMKVKRNTNDKISQVKKKKRISSGKERERWNRMRWF